VVGEVARVGFLDEIAFVASSETCRILWDTTGGSLYVWFAVRDVGIESSPQNGAVPCGLCFGSGAMPQGIIKKLADKGFGFIKGDGGDVFFHHTCLEEGVQFDDLQEGQNVEFVEGQGPKGPRAEQVRVVG
jgi:CspA family cold shock protein